MERDGRRASTLSVALCTFDGERHLPEQLASLLAQTRPPDEVVVGDDGSSDATLAILDDFARTAQYPVRLHQHDHTGPSQNFALTIAHCEGDLIALCDQDDRWLPDRLLAGEMALLARRESWLAFSDASLMGERSDSLGRTLWQSIGVSASARRTLDADPLAALLRRPMVTGCTLTFRRELMDLVEPFPQGSGLQHDRWLALCAAALGPLAVVDRPLVDYRVHGAQHTGLGPLSTSSGRPRGRLHWSRWGRMRRTGDDRLEPAIEQIEVLDRRLAGRELGSSHQVLDDCRRFLNVRRDLPRARHRRLGAVAGQLRAGSYRRFGTGWVGAVADVVRP